MPKLKRVDFIRRFVDAGLTYSQAQTAYRAVVGFFEDGVASRSQICVGHVGVLKPVKRGARTVTMGFMRDASGVRKVKRNYLLGIRISYTFKVFKAFGRLHGLAP
jgi:hypothetical protein